MNPTSLPFEYPFQWDNESLREGAGVTPEGAAILKQRDRDLEDHLASISGGGVPTYFVAAANATSRSKAYADFVCSGSADDATINEAFAAAYADYPYGARVQLSEGEFHLAASIGLSYGRSLNGLAQSTWIYAPSTSPAIDGLDGGKVSDLVLRGNTTTPQAVGINVTGDDALVTNCHVDGFTANVMVAANVQHCRVTGNVFPYNMSATFDVDVVSSASRAIVSGNVMSNAVRIAGTYCHLTDNHFRPLGAIEITATGSYNVVDGNFVNAPASLVNAGSNTNIGTNFSTTGPF